MKGIVILGKVAACGLAISVIGGAIGVTLVGTAMLVGKAGAAVGKVAKAITNELKIRKGLKDGSVVEIDGEYYEITITDTYIKSEVINR